MHTPPTADEARISEIFSSLQGEGPRMGERHLFIRFEECHIHCEYCDELEKPARPMTLGQVLETVKQLEQDEGPHSFVSLTGGEPLLYLKFLKPLLAQLKALGFRIYLETNGILWQALEEIIGWCDLVAMDLKPASVTKEKSFLAEHRRFLTLATAKDLFIKIVISKDIDIPEFQELIGLVREVRDETLVVLQGVTPLNGEGEHEDPELLHLLGELQRMAGRMIPNVRIMPRLHRILKIR